MRSRSQHSGGAFYWPAFADLMTVLVVVLLCAFAATKKESDQPHSGDRGTADPARSRIPQTLEQYESDILVGCRRCALQAFNKGSGIKLNDPFQIELCRFASGSELADGPNQCLTALQKTEDSFAHAPSLESLESEYLISFGRLYLQANTGLGNTDGEILKKRLNETQDYLKALTTGPLGRFELQRPAYLEQGPASRPSEITFGINVELEPALKRRIGKLWYDERWTDLLDIRQKSHSCEKLEVR
jgi:hypothetical protein